MRRHSVCQVTLEQPTLEPDPKDTPSSSSTSSRELLRATLELHHSSRATLVLHHSSRATLVRPGLELHLHSRDIQGKLDLELHLKATLARPLLHSSSRGMEHLHSLRLVTPCHINKLQFVMLL